MGISAEIANASALIAVHSTYCAQFVVSFVREIYLEVEEDLELFDEAPSLTSTYALANSASKVLSSQSREHGIADASPLANKSNHPFFSRIHYIDPSTLPEIGEDSSVLLSWAEPKVLNRMVDTQRFRDPESVFGPILQRPVGDVFPHPLRQRTSSAIWEQDAPGDTEIRDYKVHMGWSLGRQDDSREDSSSGNVTLPSPEFQAIARYRNSPLVSSNNRSYHSMASLFYSFSSNIQWS